MLKTNLALISPNKQAYSETFIQAHKKYLSANVNYLYGYKTNRLNDDWLPLESESEGKLVNLHLFNLILKYLSKKIFPEKLNFHEKKLLSYFENQKIKVVFAEYGITGASVRRVCTRLNIPLIVYFLGLDAYVKDVLVYHHSSYKLLFRDAFAVISVSQSMKEQLIRLGCPASKIMVNYCSPNDGFLDIQNRYNSQIFIAIGRFVAKKSPYSTIQAFSKAVKLHPDAQLWMAGEGPLWNDCKKLAATLSLENNIKFLGKVTPGQCRQLYAQGIAFVQHSVIAENGDSEGTPVAVLEASASGLPVIATKHAGIPEVVIDNETGFLVNEHDIDAMADCMSKILGDPALARKLGEAGRERIKKHFTMEEHISILNQLIEQSLRSEVMGDKRAGYINHL